jgi:hypothetical protein
MLSDLLGCELRDGSVEVNEYIETGLDSPPSRRGLVRSARGVAHLEEDVEVRTPYRSTEAWSSSVCSICMDSLHRTTTVVSVFDVDNARREEKGVPLPSCADKVCTQVQSVFSVFVLNDQEPSLFEMKRKCFKRWKSR